MVLARLHRRHGTAAVEHKPGIERGIRSIIIAERRRTPDEAFVRLTTMAHDTERTREIAKALVDRTAA
jgi:hypothetical protein